MKALAAGLAALLLVPVLVVNVGAAVVTGSSSGREPMADRPPWATDVPLEMETQYAAAAAQFDIAPALLRAVGKVECDHNRGGCSTPNAAGAVGPMQFLPTTFARWSWASGSEEPSIRDPKDAVFAAAAKLAADGGRDADPSRALYAYNHSTAYVATVIAWALVYGWRTTTPDVLSEAVLGHPRISVRPKDRVDLERQLVDARVLATLLMLATRHDLGAVGPFTQHRWFVRGTWSPSNHVFGRAVDVFAVDGAEVRASNDRARAAVVDLLTLPADVRPSEVVSPWRLTAGPATSYTDADHRDHIHLGFDA